MGLNKFKITLETGQEIITDESVELPEVMKQFQIKTVELIEPENNSFWLWSMVVSLTGGIFLLTRI